MNRLILRRNMMTVSVVLFLSIFIIVNMSKPSFLYEKDGSIRHFGLGFRKKTIIPVWLISIVLAILCYLAVLYVINAPKLYN